MRTLAIIPARGGSKGIPNKNLALLGGKPLIYHTLRAVVYSSFIDHVLVTSDNADILSFSSSFFAPITIPRTIYDRKPSLATDIVQVDEVVLDAYRFFTHLYPGGAIDTVIVLQPTSPLRTGKHIDEAVALYKEVNSVKKPFEDKDIVFSVWEPGWTYDLNLDDGGYASVWLPEYDPRFRLGRGDVDGMGYATENGAIYIVDAARFSKQRTFRSTKMIPFYMDKKSSVEIDEPIDLAIAEAILKYENNR